MKRKPAFYVVLVLLLLLTVLTVGMLVYEIVYKKDTSSVPRAIILLVGIGLSFAKLLTVTGGRGNSRAAYASAYADIVGNAFSSGGRSRKFYSAIADYNANRYKRAIRALTALYDSSADRDERFASAFFVGMCYDDMRVYPAAIEWYERALVNRRHTTALSNVGICYKRLGDLDRATLAYEEAVLIDPRNANAYVNLANIYLADEKYGKSLDCADTAISINASLAAAYSVRALALAMLGDLSGYQSSLRSYALNGGNTDALERVARSMGAPIFD